jgi:hypothetical protein
MTWKMNPVPESFRSNIFLKPHRAALRYLRACGSFSSGAIEGSYRGQLPGAAHRLWWHPKPEDARLVVGRTPNLIGLIAAQRHVRRPLLSEEKTYVTEIPKAKDDDTTAFRLVNYSPPVQPAFWLHGLRTGNSALVERPFHESGGPVDIIILYIPRAFHGPNVLMTRLLLAGPNISAWPTSLNATSSQGVLPAAISRGFDGVGSRGFRAESINEATLTPNDFPTRSPNVSSVCHVISTAMANGRNNRSVTQRLCAQARRKNA